MIFMWFMWHSHKYIYFKDMRPISDTLYLLRLGIKMLKHTVWVRALMWLLPVNENHSSLVFCKSPLLVAIHSQVACWRTWICLFLEAIFFKSVKWRKKYLLEILIILTEAYRRKKKSADPNPCFKFLWLMFSSLGSCPRKMISHSRSSSRKFFLVWITIFSALIKLSFKKKNEANVYEKQEAVNLHPIINFFLCSKWQ